VRANNPGIKIYVTFGTGQTGPDSSLVSKAANSGLTVDGWTICRSTSAAPGRTWAT
jgi:hypothetical protein